ncbi:Hypothetical_protein [Hexamita inflata]|uniref:Hypothetical_protein n=1 Tax=Hexamita inflata TaxID=28002 RepID=A0AA86RHF8_9EUKA|nr:Hypothetical protein HINF_LOCUS54655 [Hexamita inflata]
MVQAWRRKQICKIVFSIVLSPIWLPLGCIFLGIFIPIQLILNNIRIKQYQNRRRKQLLTHFDRKQQSQKTPQQELVTNISPQEQQSILFDFNSNYMGLNIKITRTEVLLVTEDDVILHSQPVPFNFQGSYFNSFCYKINDSHFMQAKVVEKQLTVQLEFNQPIVCYGQTFLSIFDFVFTIQDYKLKYFTQLPRYAYNVKWEAKYQSSGAQMFSMNNKLYCHNKSSKLFEIKPNGRIKCVNRKHYNISYYQYGNYVYATDELKIYQVKSNLKLQQIFDLGYGYAQRVYPGILIFYSSLHQRSHVILNMQNQQIVIIKTNECNFDDVNSTSHVQKLFNNKPLKQPNSYNFSLQFKQNSSKLLLNYKLNAKNMRFQCIQQQIQRGFASINEMMRQTVILNNLTANSFQNAFAFSDQ